MPIKNSLCPFKTVSEKILHNELDQKLLRHVTAHTNIPTSFVQRYIRL